MLCIVCDVEFVQLIHYINTPHVLMESSEMYCSRLDNMHNCLSQSVDLVSVATVML